MSILLRPRLFLLGAAFVGLVVLPVAVPVSCTLSINKSQEMVLRQDLFILRQLIDRYTLDKQKAPGSLEDLVKAGYLKSIPVDPFTGRRDWVIDKGPEVQDPPVPGQLPGIVAIHKPR